MQLAKHCSSGTDTHGYCTALLDSVWCICKCTILKAVPVWIKSLFPVPLLCPATHLPPHRREGNCPGFEHPPPPLRQISYPLLLKMVVVACNTFWGCRCTIPRAVPWRCVTTAHAASTCCAWGWSGRSWLKGTGPAPAVPSARASPPSASLWTTSRTDSPLGMDGKPSSSCVQAW